MIISDNVYGKYNITSPVLLELIHSKPVQRLKKISQMGLAYKYYHLKGCTRFEHSIGVMLLLKHLGASEEEQIAGLLHDISHTAFSHLVDWVVGTGSTEEFQDNQHEKYFLNSEVANILIRNGYNPQRICINKNFSLLDNDIPNLCADRIDYSMREFPLIIAKKCFSNLTTHKNKIVFEDKKTAYLFARNFLERQKIHWGGFEGTSRWVLFANALKLALKNKLIEFDDFMNDEDYVLKKLEKSANKKIKLTLQTLRKKDLSSLKKSKKNFHKKFRYVDPEFLEKNKLITLSSVDKEFKRLIETSRRKNKLGIKVAKLF